MPELAGQKTSGEHRFVMALPGKYREMIVLFTINRCNPRTAEALHMPTASHSAAAPREGDGEN